MLKIKNAISQARIKLQKSYISTPDLEVYILLEFILNKPLSYIITNSEQILSQQEYNSFFELINRRLKAEPIAYIIGKKEFYGYEFKVNQHALIPRPDTELIVDTVLEEYDGRSQIQKGQTKPSSFLELGVGSGCIIISILLQVANSKAIAVDISQECLELTYENSIIHKVEQRLHLINSNWFSNIPNRKFDIIISNPPYISLSEQEIMAKETLLYEPPCALFTHKNGLGAYEQIAQSARYYLASAGIIMLEVGVNQAQLVIELFLAYGYQLKKIRKDLAGISRVLVFVL